MREIKEETGLDVLVDYLHAICTKYHATFGNGDRAQTICFFFKCSMISGDLHIDNNETYDLRFFARESLPILFNKQHQDMLDDVLEERKGAYR